MPREPEPSTIQREFVLGALKEKMRVDGRGLLQGREPMLKFSEQELGVVECALGKTRVLAAVQATIGRPRPDRPFEGTFTIFSEISPMASPYFEAGGKPSEEEIAITRMLEKVLKRSDAVDREALCIVAGQRVWHLTLTLHFLADSGNMLDCACLAGIAALKHFRKPDVEVVGDEVTIHDPADRAPVPLSVHHIPICVSFVFADDDPQPIIDPTHLEALLLPSNLAIALTHLSSSTAPTLCVLHKAGGIALSFDEITACVDIAVRRARELAGWLEEEIERDWKGRKALVEVV
ncbi:ribosomal protein S5 domain 2-like protein [Clavulina sp. PMI_390]|nr:ribosomal protein S5 domain 2-like protein [Clavulina sp. PMI_390]